jgi:hypothetical protein
MASTRLRICLETRLFTSASSLASISARMPANLVGEVLDVSETSLLSEGTFLLSISADHLGGPTSHSGEWVGVDAARQ